MTNETHANLFAMMIALRDKLNECIDANFISDSSYDALDAMLTTTHETMCDAYENDE